MERPTGGLGERASARLGSSAASGGHLTVLTQRPAESLEVGHPVHTANPGRVCAGSVWAGEARQPPAPRPLLG